MSAPQWAGLLRLDARTLAAALGLPSPTDAQKAVIEAPPVPALVVAGAGSGKTETMSGRVVWLVANGHVSASEILGLTFTRKAAGELAERIATRLDRIGEFAERGLLPHLESIVASGRLDRVHAAAARGADAVRRGVLDQLATEYDTGWNPAEATGMADLLDRPRVSTYNAFADQIVREHAAHIGRDPEAALLSESAAWLIVRDVVMSADEAGLDELDNALSTIIDRVKALAGDVLDHRVDTAVAAEYTAHMAAAMSGAATTADARGIVSNVAALPTLLHLVDEYGAEKSRRGVLDFSDQVTGALDIVERAPQVADELVAQYPVVLLDEYQDTSVTQTELLATVFRDTAVMAVGDPHQSIYGWRGASADNLPSFGTAFANRLPVERYDLMTSWRNDRTVLAAANRLLAPLRAEGGFHVAPLKDRPGAGDGRVEAVFPHSVDDEAATVAGWFAAMRAGHSGDKPLTGAILFRAKKHMQKFADELAVHGIPHRVLGLGGLLAAPEVVDVVSALRVVHDPTQGSALIRLLVGPRFGIGVADMAALYDLATALSQRDEGLRPLDADIREKIRASTGPDEQVSIIDALDVLRQMPDDYRLFGGITPEGRQRMREAAAMFDRLRYAAGQPVPEVIRLIELELRLDIELAANEVRGPARSAAAQLRAFSDEVRGFLQADPHGTIGSLLAWLDHAERADDLRPRTEPPEPGVVQLLTIHGSKGLEWDAVAVVRMVESEVPQAPRSTTGWLSFGQLPYELRGDARALPQLDWAPGEDGKAFGREMKAFREANRAHHLAEERRLAYVAVTRARSRLLLSGSFWAGQTRARRPSEYLTDIIDELGLDRLVGDAGEDNPYEGEGRTAVWPLDPLGARRERVVGASELARAMRAKDVAAPFAPTPRLRRLIEERRQREATTAPKPPTRVPASRFKDYVTDYSGTVREAARPMPERPYRQTRLGTLFHQWVEQRSGLIGAGPGLDDALWERDDEALDGGAGSAEAAARDEADLARLRETFERSEWARLAPIAVETEIDFALDTGEGEPPHIVICKLDAVYERDGRTEIVDWKTGRAPRTAVEREERMLQLALYRLAYHRRHGVPMDDVDVALYYVADDLVLRDHAALTEAEIVERWRAARRAAG